jgi:hypothetical protein
MPFEAKGLPQLGSLPRQNDENAEAKMSVDQTDKIDFLWKDDQRGCVMLTITDHFEWEEDDEVHLEMLQEKLNAYMHFVESGELLKARPAYKGLPVVIHVRAKYQLSDEAAKFYKLAKKSVAKAGASLEFDYAP